MIANTASPPAALPGVSVVICCYNSALRLPLTLKHLAGQSVPETIAWEILVVNNASTDDTVECARSIWEQWQPGSGRLRIVTENTPGQMHARKTGAKEARFGCLIFCDDDNLLDKNYVSLAYGVMAKDSGIGAAGGKNLPMTDAPAYPEWFEEYMDKYATGVPAPQSGDISYKAFILGAGMVTRKDLFLRMFDDRYPSLLSGRNGEKLSTGDDFEYCKRLILRGYTLYYDERLLLYHFIPKERLTIGYRERLMKGIEEAGLILNEYDRAIKAKKRLIGKSKLRLLILTPFRMLLATAGLSTRNSEDEKLLLDYINPFRFSRSHNRDAIRAFMNGS